MTEAIKGFEGQYAFLSNFEGPGFWFGGIVWPTNEHFYQAQKTNDLNQQMQVATAATPKEAKRLGRKVVLRSDWDHIKDDVMRLGLALKFQDRIARRALIDTEDAYLEETNWWKDTYWGVCNGVGTNKLGFLLMELRDRLQC